MSKTEHRKNLTPTLINGLKPAPDGTRYQVMDAQVPGFGVRVTDTGNRTFILRTRYPGSSSPSRREIGNCVDISLTDAREKARKWRSMVGEGIDPIAVEAAERAAAAARQATTFESVAEDYDLKFFVIAGVTTTSSSIQTVRTRRDPHGRHRRFLTVSEETKELHREALTISEVCSACGVGRTKIFESIADGSLKARKFGKRTLVLPDDLREFLAALPTA